jgi:two-component system, NarL family, sensor histidine kinase DesK
MGLRSRGTGRASVDEQARELYDSAAQWPRPPLFLSGLNLRHTPGTGSPVRWLFSSIWLVYLVQPVSELFGRHDGHQHSALWIAGGVAITVVFCAVYAPIIVNTDRWPRLAHAGLGALVLLAATACIVYGQNWTALWIYVSAAAGMILAATTERRVALLGVLFTGACYVFFSWLSHLSAGNLAANEERLRLARDMHDLTGQSLSMITLKSDLAAKRLTRLAPSAERDAVLGELGDIGRVSRQTLHDIREAVSGYRRPTLAIEVITARNALESAGVRLDDDPELTLRSGELDPEAEAVLAWCLREAVTNVIRHSGARSCRIRLMEGGPELSLEVTDDGRGFSGRDAQADQADPADQGSGLHGMSERLSAVGGRLSISPASAGGFRLTATLPALEAMPVTGHNSEL